MSEMENSMRDVDDLLASVSRGAITTRPMERSDEAAANALYAPAFPTLPPRGPLWWWAHPTVVALEGDRLVGYASFSISAPPTPTMAQQVAQQHAAEIGWGHGMAVHPEYRGRGIGRQLFEARAAVMRELGLRFFIGHAVPGNAPMEALFAEQKLAPTVTAPQEDGTPLTYYMGRL